MKIFRLILLVLVPFLIFGIALLAELPILHWLELKSIDWRFSLREPVAPSGEVVIVSIDEKSLHQEGRWPWPRSKVASLIQGINNLEPKLIGLDIIFAEPSVGDDALRREFTQNNNVIVGYYFYHTLAELEEATLSSELLQRSFESILPTALPQRLGLSLELREMSGVVANIPQLAQVALAQGFFNTLPDSDGVIRKAPLFLSYKGQSFPSLALGIFSQHNAGFDAVPIRNREGVLEGVSLGSHFIPTDQGGAVWINYTGENRDFPIYSATDILQGRVDKNLVRDKTVLVGATAVGIYDLRVTPFSPVTPGILVQANLLDSLYRGDYLSYNEGTRLASFGAMFLMTLFIMLLLFRGRLLWGLVFSHVVIFGYLLLALWMFERGVILSLVSPTVDAIVVAFTITTYRGLTEEIEKQKIRKVFQSYLHPEVIAEIIKNPENLKLGGHREVCSILFSDVRNFTSISEKMDPVILVNMMNEYFDPISREIIGVGGYIDKFIGDAVMAVFGVPKKSDVHPILACRAALAMQKKVRELEPYFREKFGIEAFKIGIGIHTGPVIVGNIGTKERLNYTVMGDSVNLASRLESATKTVGADILISHATFEQVQSLFTTEPKGEISVKGKEEKIRVYQLKPSG